MLEKAIALPKSTLLQRWRPLDVPAAMSEWPRLPEEFLEAEWPSKAGKGWLSERQVVAWSDLHSDMGALDRKSHPVLRGKNMTHLRQLPAAQAFGSV